MTGLNPWRILAVGLLAVPLIGVSVPVFAQSVEELEQELASSAKPAEALALARSQADSGALLEALGTLERALAIKPKMPKARLLHASILCRIDDREGAAMEFSRLKAGDFKKAEWRDAVAPCSETAVQP